ncbi:hypothetical protein BJ508DRAFT_358617 [Ascobolus immersus RN42]|uniref:Uncharacterized protein n=1 Tax=Ascobolus immersus RN42 TaxID=1160509 RepID=A0A3N4IJ45_ASCIM|nr:hypothetical protein BJ508DRAFT_358617 [Ascobolus immersus RN42]
MFLRKLREGYIRIVLLALALLVTPSPNGKMQEFYTEVQSWFWTNVKRWGGYFLFQAIGFTQIARLFFYSAILHNVLCIGEQVLGALVSYREFTATEPHAQWEEFVMLWKLRQEGFKAELGKIAKEELRRRRSAGAGRR